MGTVDEKEEGGAVGVAPYESAVIAAVGGDLRKKCDEKYPVSFIKQLCWHEGEKKKSKSLEDQVCLHLDLDIPSVSY